MTRYFRPLAASAAALGVVSVVALADPPEPAKPATLADVSECAAPATATTTEATKPAEPAKPVEMKFAVEPQPLGEAVQKGLKYLANQQQEDGGWSQGGGWRTAVNGQGGRIEGAEVEDPSDVGNTCIALLAFIRAGNTPDKGEYNETVRKGLKFVYGRVEKANKDDLYVTDVRNTQLQSKIGPFVDTFLAALVLSEIKGKAGDDEKQLMAALDKTIGKMAKHQKDDGTIVGNGGWAPVLSQGLFNKSLARAQQNGVAVDRQLLARAAIQSETSVGGPAKVAGVADPATVAGDVLKPGEAVATRPTTPTPTSGPAVDGGVFSGRTRPTGIAGGVGDAGVELYRFSQGAGNMQDVFNSIAVDARKAREVLQDKDATDEAKTQAERTVEQFREIEKTNARANDDLAARAKDAAFVKGFGNNGGEEFLSFLNISETLILKGGQDWTDWNGKMQEMLVKAQDGNGSWSGHHCITGKTFCTAAALVVMMADRTPFPVDVIDAAREANKKDAPKDEPAKEEKK